MTTATGNRADMEAAIAVLYQCLDEAPPDRVMWFSSPHALLDYQIQRTKSIRTICLDEPELTINRPHSLRNICLPKEIQNLIIDDEIEPSLVLSRYFGHTFVPPVVARALLAVGCTARATDYCYAMSSAQAMTRCFFINGRSGLLPLINTWFLPYANRCLISEPHVALHVDDAGLPHNTTGPAIAYPDGWGVYAVHGTVVPPQWITEPSALTPETALRWPNLEQRRAACELLGWERILRELDARTIDADPDPEIGTLLEATLPDVGRARFLRVKCPTGRWFCLQVPPEMQTALEANAWSYGLDPDTYLKLEGRT